MAGTMPQQERRGQRAAWREYAGDSPYCGPGDHEKASAYVARLERAIAQGGWTKHEREHLYGELEKWGRRARGQDARFEVVGTRPGALSMPDECKVVLLERTMAAGRRAGEKEKRKEGK